MQDIIVKDLMVPLDEYATVSEEASLYDAVIALEKALEDLDRTRYQYLHRAILILDKNNKVVGKLSQLDVLRALEPKYSKMGDNHTFSRSGFNPEFLRSMLEKLALFDEPLKDICVKASKRKIKGLMYTPTEGEYVNENASLIEAIHQLVMGHHQSLLVIGEKKDDIVGILRLSDIFKDIFQTIKTCDI